MTIHPKKELIEIDAAAFETRYRTHAALKEIFAGYDYYGSNLDALHDVLTSIAPDTILRIIHFETAEQKLGTYAASLRRVFLESGEENPHLTVRFEDFP